MKTKVTKKDYKKYLKSKGIDYKEGQVYFGVMTFTEFQQMNYNPIEELYSLLDLANEAWYKAVKEGQDCENDICCDGYHAKRNAMNYCHKIEEMEKNTK